MSRDDRIDAMRRILDWATDWDRFDSDEEREDLYELLNEVEDGSYYD